jgi:phage terminase large subunit-like protein
VDRLREVCATYDVAEIAYDPWGIPDMIADQLVAEGVPLVKYPQTPQLMCPASQGLFEAVTAGDLEHDGGEILASHIAAATPRDVRQSWRLDKDAARSPSDAAIALAMALDRAREWGPADENDFVIRYG